MPRFRLTVLLISVLLNGCALLSTQPSPTDKLSMPLAPPNAPTRRVVQQITAHWQQREASLLCVLELDKRHIAMAGLSNEGLSLFNLQYDGKQLHVEKTPLFTEALAPEFIIADLQLVSWSVPELEKVLVKPWQLVASPKQRELYYQQEKIATVHYISADTVELDNHHYHYQLRIKTLSHDTISE